MKNAPDLAKNSFQGSYKHAFFAQYKDTPGCAEPSARTHDRYELLLCLSNDMFCNVGNKRLDVKADSLLLFNSSDPHLFGPLKPDGENRRYVLDFEPSFMNHLSEGDVNLLDCFLFRPFEHPNLLELSCEQSALLQGLLDRIIRLQSEPFADVYGNAMRLLIAVRELMLEVNILFRGRHAFDSSAGVGSRQLVYDIISYVNQNYAEELRLDALAQTFYINKYSLCQSFKQITGITLNRYIINYRLQKAKEFLSKGYSVESVCAQAGFNNLSHFSRQFKNKVGQSPKQFQKQFRKDAAHLNEKRQGATPSGDD